MPIVNDLPRQSKIKKLFSSGMYYWTIGRRVRNNGGKMNSIYVDAGILKKTPWLEMELLEKKIFQQKNFFRKGILQTPHEFLFDEKTWIS